MSDIALNDTLLLDYMEGFFGYGNLNGHYWFVGMEEGSDGTIAEIRYRLHRWEERGKLPIEDVVAYSGDGNTDWFFGPHARLQPTWNKLIRIQLRAAGVLPHTEMVR